MEPEPVIVNGTRIAIQKVLSELENIANGPLKQLVNSKKLPEYQIAIDAINNYKKATIKQLETNFKEEKIN